MFHPRVILLRRKRTGAPAPFTTATAAMRSPLTRRRPGIPAALLMASTALLTLPEAALAVDNVIDWTYSSQQGGNDFDILQCQAMTVDWSGGDGDMRHSLYEFNTEEAYTSCDFSVATRIRGPLQRARIELSGADTLEVTKRWFGSRENNALRSNRAEGSDCTDGMMKFSLKTRPNLQSKFPGYKCLGDAVEKKQGDIRGCRMRCKSRRGCVAIDYDSNLGMCKLYSRQGLTGLIAPFSPEVREASNCEVAIMDCSSPDNLGFEIPNYPGEGRNAAPVPAPTPLLYPVPYPAPPPTRQRLPVYNFVLADPADRPNSTPPATGALQYPSPAPAPAAAPAPRPLLYPAPAHAPASRPLLFPAPAPAPVPAPTRHSFPVYNFVLGNPADPTDLPIRPPTPRPTSNPLPKTAYFPNDDLTCPEQSPFDSRQVMGLVDARTIPEASGLVAGVVNPEVLFTHNDLNGYPQIFALDGGSGSLLGVFPLMGAAHVDYEAITSSPGPNGQGGKVYVGDIGDNYNDRESVQIYRLDEPNVHQGSYAVSVDTLDITYEGVKTGVNAECLMYDPYDGLLYIVTKEDGSIYRTPRPWGEGSTSMEMEYMGNMMIGNGYIVGCDIDISGREVMVKLYDEMIYFCRSPGQSLVSALLSKGGKLAAYGYESQGEAVAFGGGYPAPNFYTLSEARGARWVPLYGYQRL